ncbi:MAG: hypothetical protein RLZZ04_200 [Cyanobacteriota bacterium]
MTTDAIALAQKVKHQFEEYKAQQQFEEIAQLIASALQILPQKYNQQIFGYIPQIFRQIELKECVVQAKDICFGEPVIYKLYFPGHQKLYGFAYFYIFCYLKHNSSQLNVYFQSANPSYKKLTPDEYDLAQGKISFEASISSFKSDYMSVISISDPGHFIPGLTSSYYVGSEELNFNQIIAQVLENICRLANISLQETMLFGSSAGTFGALLSSTYLQQKTNVLAVNSQINLHYKAELMQIIFKQTQPKLLLEKFGNQISCTYRFEQDIASIPNLYILANINDNLHNRNFEFYKQYLSRFTQKGRNNQSIFDSYYGIEHGRPEANSLRAKIRLAREILTMQSI